MATAISVGAIIMGGKVRRSFIEPDGSVNVGESDGTGDAMVYAEPLFNREARTTVFNNVTVTIASGYAGWEPKEIARALLADCMVA